MDDTQNSPDATDPSTGAHDNNAASPGSEVSGTNDNVPGQPTADTDEAHSSVAKHQETRP